MLQDKLQAFLARHNELNTLLSDSAITADLAKMKALSKEQKSLEPIVAKAKDYLFTLKSIDENKALLADSELGELAKEELKSLENAQIQLEDELKILLLPKDANDERNVFLEIRAGTGGDEAALFVGDLVKAYARYAEIRGYKIEIVSSSEGSVGGFKEIILLVKGEGAYSRLKFEGGTHRVQRVPETESQGRVHTSAITVAIMPEVDDIEVEINENDLDIQVMRASGHGGQSVNTTDSAVRLTHIPTGIVIYSQTEKSQLQNKAKAFALLRSKLYDMELQKQHDAEAAERKSQVGTGDRSEKIRTYNFPEGRVTDHRIKLTLYKLDQIMNGDLDEIIDSLIAADQAAKLSNMQDEE